MRRVRSIFLSDIHLGTRACQAGRLLAFLRVYDAEYVYLLGEDLRHETPPAASAALARVVPLRRR